MRGRLDASTALWRRARLRGRRCKGSSAGITAPSIAYTWGSTAAERGASFPCDAYVTDADAAYFRAVDVDAPFAVVFRWLCQLKAAPYSYDWIDNLGRRSPRRLTPDLERLARGQRVMTIFELVEFEHDRHLTIILARPFLGTDALAMTYAVRAGVQAARGLSSSC